MENNNPEKPKAKTFEDILPILDNLLKMAAHKWNLKAVPSITFDDISQIVRIHVWKKFHLYNQDLPVEPWMNTIINNQIRNLLRNHYYQNVSVCERCPENEGNGLCRIYGKQESPECKLFTKWEKSKKNAYNIRISVPLENHTQEVSEIPWSDSNLEKSAELLHKKVLPLLRENEKRVYILLYIKGLSEEKAAEILGYKSTEARKVGYNNFIRIKKTIMVKVKKAMEEIDIY